MKILRINQSIRSNDDDDGQNVKWNRSKIGPNINDCIILVQTYNI